MITFLTRFKVLTWPTGCCFHRMQSFLKFFRPAARMPTEKALTFVNDKIKNHKVVVFSKTYCPFCIKAKKALETILSKDQYEVVELDTKFSDDVTIIEAQDALGEITGARSVPRVFIAGKFIGGGDDTAAKAANGELAQLLKAVDLP